MAFTDRVVEHPGRVKLTNVSGDIYDITPYEGEVTAPGTLLNAANLNQQTQLDSDTAQAFSDAGASMDRQNDMSGALAFLLEKNAEAYVTEYGTVQGGTGNNWWSYRKWSNGATELFGVISTSAIAGSAWASPLYYTDQDVTFPSGIFEAAPTEVFLTGAGTQWWPIGTWNYTTSGFRLRAAKPTATAQALVMRVHAVKYPTA